MSFPQPALSPPGPVAEKDWVIEKEGRHPQLGRVIDVYWDEIDQEWLIDIELYSPDGRLIGRESDALGGPEDFEPAVPMRHWSRIAKPVFPMKRDRTGYRDWRDAAEILGPRTAARQGGEG